MVETATSAETVEPADVLEPYYIADAIRPKAAFTVKITPTKHTGTHPLAGALAEQPPAVSAFATTLIDASLQDGTSTAVLPTIIHVPFTTINSGTAATIDGSGNLNFNVTGEGNVLLTQVVLLSGSTAPYNVYLVWTWGGRQTYLGKVQLPPDDGTNAWLITVNGLISIVAGQALAINLATDATGGHTLYWWQQDFQLGVPTSAFPSFTPTGGLPAPLPTPGSDNAIPVPPVSAGPVPMSVAGINQPVFGTGSATSPTAASWIPQFTTTFPSPTVVFSNVWTVPTISGGVWTTHLPAYTVTTQNIALGGWGLPGPSGQGPGPPTYPNPPGAGKPFMMAEGTEAEPAEAPPPEPERAEVSTASGSTGETTIFAHEEEEEEIHEHHRRRRGRPRRA